MTSPAPSPLYGTLVRAFSEAAWDCTEVAGREVLRAGFEAHHTRVDLHVQVFAPLSAVSVVAESPFHTGEPARRERLAELAMRVNETLTVGNFELLWDSGRLAFRATNLFPSPEGDARIIQGLVQTAVGEMDRISPLVATIHRAPGPELAALQLPRLLAESGDFPGSGLEGMASG